MYVKTWKRPGFAYLPEKIFGNKLKAHFVYLLPTAERMRSSKTY